MFSCVRERERAAAVALIALLSLSACSAGMKAAVDSVRYAVQRGGADATTLDPQFAYLRVTRGNHVGLLWRGSIERSPQGPIEVYYGGAGEIVRLRDGRVVAVLGLPTEWRRVEVAAPTWGAAASARNSPPYTRLRDVMPGYRSAVRDELVLNLIPAPDRSALQGLDAKTLTWFEETAERRGGVFGLLGGAPETLPPARYAVDLRAKEETVVYAEQCLARDLCFTWQRWSAAMQQAVAAPRAQ